MFDFGGVLSRFGVAGDSVKRFSQVLGCDPRLVQPQLGGLIGQWMAGKIATPEFWTEAADLVNAPAADYDTLWRASEPQSYDLDYYNFARSLREQGYKTGIISNVYPSSEEIIRKASGYRDFDPVVLSCVTGFLKPEPAIYAVLLSKLQLPPEEVLMVDDRPLHLKGAEAAGLQSVLAGDPRTTMKQILRHLLMPQEVVRR